jgi:hypothetical protein
MGKFAKVYIVGYHRFGFIIELERYISIYSRKIYRTKQEARDNAERIANMIKFNLKWEE